MADKTMVDFTNKIKPYFQGVAPVEPTTTAAAAYSAGEQFYLDGTLVEALTSIAIGDTLTLNTNYKVVGPIETQLRQVKQALTDLSKEVPNSEAYVLRQGKGNMVSLNLVGGSVAWNQLVNTSDTSVTVPNGHKYIGYIGGTLAKATSDGTAISVTGGTDKIFDITQMFGTTVADALTADQFAQYFPNYASASYNSGVIQSVNVKSRKVVGKNLLEVILSPQTESGISFTVLGDGTIVANGTSTAQIFLNISYSGASIKRFKKGAYKLSGCASGSNSTYFLYATDKTNNDTNYLNYSGDTEITLNKDSDISFTINIRSGQTLNNVAFKPMLRFADTDDTYEPYKEISYDFDSSKTLLGYPILVNGELQFDGDIYKADGSDIKKYDIVDLSSLNWTFQSDWGSWYADYANIKSPSSSSVAKMISSKYVAVPVTELMGGHTTIGIAISDARSRIIVRNGSSSEEPTGYLVFEVDTPTTETAEPYQNPQRAFIDGTEEFIDAGVEATTRDVSIPVGNNSVYAIGETLPQSEDYTDGANKALLDTIKAVVADSSDFADFQTKMAAL